MTSTLTPKQQRSATRAWALWDWAEQPYPTIMQTFVFPVYLASAVAGVAGDATECAPGQTIDSQLGWATAAAGLILALTAPVIGRRSDESGKRKFWVVFNTYFLVAIMIASFFVEPKVEFLMFGLVPYALGSIVQEAAFINYYAMLKDVTTEKNIGRVSGYAWGLGYAGGIILLLISLVAFIRNDFFAQMDGALNIRFVFLFAAVWTAVFALPLIFKVPEIEPQARTARVSILGSYKALWLQLKTLKQQAPDTFKFLISSAVYRDGLAGVFTFGAVLGTLAFDFETPDVLMFGVAANVVAGLGAAAGGFLDDRIGSKNVILASLLGLIGAGVGLFFAAPMGPTAYWIFGLILCLFVGPAQASSRTFVSRFTPKGREGEVFGLYQTTGRAVSFLSGTMWASTIAVATALNGCEGSTIYGIWGLMLILIVGAILLSRVNPRPAVLESN